MIPLRGFGFVERHLASLFILPYIVIANIFGIFPLAYSMYVSLTEYNLARPHLGMPFVGMANYIILLGDPNFQNSIMVTFTIVAGAVFVQVLAGLVLALLLNLNLKGAGFVKILLLLPMMVTPSVTGIIWRILYTPTVSPINYYLQTIGLIPPRWLSSDFVIPSIIIADSWQWTPFVMLILLAGLQNLPPEPIEAAKIDGASRWQMLRYVTLPLLKPIILTAIVLRTIGAFKIFDMVFILTRGALPSSEVASIFVVKRLLDFYYVGYSAASSYLFAIIIMVISILYIWVLRR